VYKKKLVSEMYVGVFKLPEAFVSPKEIYWILIKPGAEYNP
jgi:hypothetical protein